MESSLTNFKAFEIILNSLYENRMFDYANEFIQQNITCIPI